MTLADIAIRVKGEVLGELLPHSIRAFFTQAAEHGMRCAANARMKVMDVGNRYTGTVARVQIAKRIDVKMMRTRQSIFAGIAGKAVGPLPAQAGLQLLGTATT